MRYIIKAFIGYKEAQDAQMNISDLYDKLNEKADTNLSNLTDKGRISPYPSNTYITISEYCNSGKKFVPPTNGWIYYEAFGTANAFADIRINDWLINNVWDKGDTQGMVCPVTKGTPVSLAAGANISSFYIRFYYAQGEVPS